jgi:GNAT superfamily N-acetyltransferase
VKIKEFTFLDPEQKTAVFNLWNHEYPKNICYQSLAEFEGYLQKLQEPRHYLLLDTAKKITGWGFDFIRDEEKWFAIIIKRQFQRKGYGGMLLERIRQNNDRLSGWVIDHNNYVRADGEKYTTPIRFYQQRKFRICPEIRLGLELISAVKIEWTK